MFSTEPRERTSFLVDQAGKIVSWNANCAALFGLAASQAIGQTVCTLLDPASRGEWSERWAQLVAAGHPGELTVRMPACGGPVSLNLAPQYGAAAAFEGCVASVTSVGTHESEAERVARTPMSTIVEMFPGTFYALNRDRRFVLWNRNLERLAEMTPDELAAANALEFFDVKERPRIAEAIRQVFDDGKEIQIEADHVTRSGREIPMLLCGTRVPCIGGDYLFGMGLDITDQRQQEQQLRLRERALHAASNGIVITGCERRDHPIEYVNPAFERITGYSAAEVMGRDPRFMAVPDTDSNERNQVREALDGRRAVNVVFRNRRKNGELFWNDLNITPVTDETGHVTHFIGVMNDVTATKQRTAHLEHEVNHDPLTGLANRNLLWDRLEQSLHLAQRHKSLVAVVLIDLNNFKSVNDTFGHEAGDVVLKVVAKRLQASVRDSDTVSRLSGDEFVLVLVNQPSLRYALRMIERVRSALTMPVSFNRKEIPVGASLGVSVYPHDGVTAADLVRASDVAMYHAKASGRNEVAFFSADMKSTTEAKQRLEHGMREALERDELFLVYQPRVDLRSGKVRGFEALLRWRHPENGVLLPSAFLAEAEESGTIVPIGNRVLDQACAFLDRLKQLGYDELPLSVNVSQREYCQHDFVAGIGERLRRFGLSPHNLEVELREEALIRNPGLGRDVAAQLRSLGTPLTVDAFGHGISDLAFLQQLDVAQVKLARSTVHAAAGGKPAGKLAKTLIDIGHNLEMAVIGEAVETRAQMEFLASNGCDQIQGTWFSEPLPEEQACELLKTRQFA
ncbi:EAL domain-containing protein [Massilia solisilvae]|uniref:EAL domain-containing protein n=1 Tax=Massilia solisilvae TaxID=1811225 RepID=A0ABT2BJZ0_9BURK|nr:EAL domain-containing protein [Massilia solisilvae]MCS0608731.1 EAL domain-containing protein [Massilia solisilvae]